MAIRNLYVEAEVADSKMVNAISTRLKLRPKVIRSAEVLYAKIGRHSDPIKAGKESLLLCRNKGPFVRQCPGTRAYTCCDYTILHIGAFCTMDCSYCILQAYFHPPVLKFFVNHGDMAQALLRLFDQPGIHRVGTGEFTDSMIWEPYTNLSSILVPLFSRQNRAVLELKTKTTAIDGLKDLSHNRRTICAWSVNTKAVMATEEKGTASLTARLQAAATCQSWGYPLAFHFDPMVIYEGCEADYLNVVAQIFEYVSAQNIVWISLGTFRFMPDLKAIIQKRFECSKIVYGEFIPGLDGKMRYFKPLRIALYRKIAAAIKSIAPHVTVYFCMEDDEVWQKTMGFLPKAYGGLGTMLDKSAIKVCGLTP